MTLLNNKFFIIGVVLVLVIGLLGLAQLMDTNSVSDLDEFETTNPEYNTIKNEIDRMSQSNWDNTVYYRIKKSIDGYFDVKKIDQLMHDNLKVLLLKKYLLKLTETTQEFCEKSADMGLWNELNSEISKFSNNPDMNTAISLLNDYRYIRNTALAAEDYGKNEKYDADKSAGYEAIFISFNNKSFIKDNPTLKNEVSSALVAIGRVSGLENKFNTADFNTCNCYNDFGKNEFYKDACIKSQSNQ